MNVNQNYFIQKYGSISMSHTPDFRDVEIDDEIKLTLTSGESFTGIISSKEYDPADITKGYISLGFEGDLWDQVKDRVDSEVLQIRQDLARKTGDPKEAVLTGTVWVGEDEESSVSEYQTLGTIQSFDKQ